MNAYSQDISLSERKKKKLYRRIEKSLSSLQNDPKNYKLHIELGDSYSLLEEFPKAEAHYSSAIELLKEAPIAEKVRKEIIMLYGKILSIAPNNREAHTALGEEYLAAGQKEKAFRFLLSSAKKATENDDYELALQCYNQVVEMGKSNPHIIERCTEMYLKLGKKQDAVENYIHIGDIYAKEEKSIEALDYYKKASAIHPEEPEILVKIARMYYAMGWTENAATELVKLAEHHEHRQHYNEALKYYQNSMRLDPENEKAQAGARRIAQQHIIESPWEQTETREEFQTQHILAELDQIEEEALGQQLAEEEQEEMEIPLIDLTKQEEEEETEVPLLDVSTETEPEETEAPVLDVSEETEPEEIETPLLDVNEGTEKETTEAPVLDVSAETEEEESEAPLFDVSEETESEETEAPVLEREEPVSDVEPEQTEVPLIDLNEHAEEDQNDNEREGKTLQPSAWEDRFVDLEEFSVREGEKEEAAEEEAERVQPEPVISPESTYPEEIVLEDELEPSLSLEMPEDEDVDITTDIQFIPENTLHGSSEDHEHISEAEFSAPKAEEAIEQEEQQSIQRSEVQPQESLVELQQKIEDLERHLENTEEEKYFLQEQFTAQIHKLKAHETSLKKEFEIAIEDVSKDKKDLEHRLEHIISAYQSAREDTDQGDETRYETIIEKIQKKKFLLQKHLNTLLKQREENGRFLAEELKTLSTTKHRLKDNIEYIQQVKTRIEEKINTELLDAQQKIQTLATASKELEDRLRAQKQKEQGLQEKFEKLHREKDAVQDEYTETVTALTGENERLEHQVQELSIAKAEIENSLKKKFQTLETSFQQLQKEYKISLASKEQELSETANRLSQFADRYVKLEKTLSGIRQERDKLDGMLAKETATREKLQEKLVEIETHVDSLEIQGTELLEQLGTELDRQFTIKQNASDEFQVSLEELEKLLSLQEQEIQSLETIS